ncbi:MAG: signal recognition particle protein [Burkholderiales bacterium]
MFDSLTQRLSAVINQLRGQARLTEANIQDGLREVRMALLEADVALPVVKEVIEHIKQRALGQEVLRSLSPGQTLVGIVSEELTRLMGGTNAQLNLATRPPAVILMAGLQGSGKTTTCGKLAKFLHDQHKKKVLLASCDVYRPAAQQQLQILAQQIAGDYFPTEGVHDPQQIALAALDHARKHYHDVLIVDSAGRLAIDTEMMDEIKRLHAALQPIETLLVVDAMQGQDAVNTARAFAAALPLTGTVLTKLDGDARGGAALSVRHVTGQPIKFAGVGEKPNGLEEFHPDRMTSRILGMGDVLTLVDEARRSIDQQQVQDIARKLKTGKGFDLDDFKMQLQQMKKMGGMSALVDKLPMPISKAAGAQMDDRGLARIEGIINSMTPEERARPELLKASRKRRVAAGSGVQVQEVNRLISQFEQMQKMMKTLTKGGMAKMMRGMKGMFPGMH